MANPHHVNERHKIRKGKRNYCFICRINFRNRKVGKFIVEASFLSLVFTATQHPQTQNKLKMFDSSSKI